MADSKPWPQPACVRESVGARAEGQAGTAPGGMGSIRQTHTGPVGRQGPEPALPQPCRGLCVARAGEAGPRTQPSSCPPKAGNRGVWYPPKGQKREVSGHTFLGP